MRSDRAQRNPHLVDEHDGENRLVDEPGLAAGGEGRQTRAGQKRTSVSHVSKKGKRRDTAEVGQSSAEFNLREALDSLQDDVELSSLAGTNGDTSGLNKRGSTRDSKGIH